LDLTTTSENYRSSACSIIKSVMRLIATVAALAVAGFCTADSQKPGAPKEPAFGIEFSMENIKISVAPCGDNAKGIASIRGNEAYRNLMYTYFELCYWAHGDQVPPWSYEDDGTTAGYAASVAAMEGLPNQVSWRYEAHPDETDVEILADAVETVERAAADILADEHGVTMPDRPLVSLAAPSFMWTMTELDFWDGKIDANQGTPYNYDRGDWHHGFALKISDAVREAGFRLELTDDTTAAISPRRLDHTFPIAPAGYAAFWNPNFSVDADSRPATSRGTQYEGPPAVVLELTNATLSLWAQRNGQIWSPWYTRPQLGAHLKFEDLPDHMYSPDDWIWEEILFVMRKLRSIMALPESEDMSVYLTGDAWLEEMVEAFTEHLRIDKVTKLDVRFRGGFAAGDGAACAARGMLDTTVTEL
jgi:hypothetical protein